MLKLAEMLINWLVGCWSCQDCTWRGTLTNILSCAVRTLSAAALLYLIARYIPIGG